MSELVELGKYLYAYCTDFIINLGNILKLSYYEMNFIIFCIIYPLLTFGLILLYLIQKRRLKKIKKEYNNA